MPWSNTDAVSVQIPSVFRCNTSLAFQTGSVGSLYTVPGVSAALRLTGLLPRAPELYGPTSFLGPLLAQ